MPCISQEIYCFVNLAARNQQVQSDTPACEVSRLTVSCFINSMNDPTRSVLTFACMARDYQRWRITRFQNLCQPCSFEWGPRPCWPFGRIQILLAAPSLAPKPGELWHFKSKCQGYTRKVYQWGPQSCDTRKTIQHGHEGETGDEGADHHDEDKNDTNMCVCVCKCACVCYWFCL